jgi:hypothetical protein
MKAIPPFEPLEDIDPKSCKITEDSNHEQQFCEGFRSRKLRLLPVCEKGTGLDFSSAIVMFWARYQNCGKWLLVY